MIIRKTIMRSAIVRRWEGAFYVSTGVKPVDENRLRIFQNGRRP